MADETQVTPVAGAENATQENEKKLYVYYFSDPDAKDPLLRFHIIYSDVEFVELPWHVHTEKPDESLKSPVWSNDVNGWVEDSKDGQAEILAQAQTQIEALDKSKAELDQTVKTLQTQQEAGTAQDLALTKSIKELSEGQANQNQLLASMQSLMLTIASSQKTAAPTQPTQATTATQPVTGK